MGIGVTWTEYQKMEYRAALRWCFSSKKRENSFASKRWHPSFKRMYPFSSIAKMLEQNIGRTLVVMVVTHHHVLNQPAINVRTSSTEVFFA